MAKELELVEYYDEMQTVVEAYITGNTNPTEIAKQLGLSRKKVLDYIDEWREVAKNHPDRQARAQESITAMDKHYDIIIKSMWQIVDTEDDNKIRSTVLKNIADVEAKRQESLVKAGIYDNDSMAAEVVEMEEKAEEIKSLLKEIAQRFPETRLAIMEGLTNIFGGQNSVPVSEPLKGQVTDA